MLVFYTGYSQIHHCLSLHINRDAYKVACLGVTEGDWRALAMEAMEVNYMYMTLIYLILTQGVMGTFPKSQVSGSKYQPLKSCYNNQL